MANIEKYKETYITVLNVSPDYQIETLSYRDLSWDSVAHMVLMATLEETFDIQLETDDVIDFSSYEKGLEILRKYGVEL